MKLDRFTCSADFERTARRILPRMFYDYVNSGAWTESTYRQNTLALRALPFVQRVCVDISRRRTESTMVGTPVAMPMAIAPTGLAGMLWPDGEIAGCRAAQEFGIPFTLSTMSICSIEDVAQACRAPFWFQLYVMKDRGFSNALIDRAREAGCTALIVTLDLQLYGQRNKDIKNGLTVPIRPTIGNLLNCAAKPRWLWRMRRARHRSFGNIVGHVRGVDSLDALTKWTYDQYDATLTWADIEAIRHRWHGKLVLKGITNPVDAKMASALGVDAIVVSNHGGRQLDGAPASIAALVDVVAAAGGQTEIWVDGGIRSGQDVLRARALGARGVLLGRAFLYVLAVAGQAGVRKLLQLMQNELSTTMGFCGQTDIDRIDSSVLVDGGVPYLRRDLAAAVAAAESDSE